MHHTSSVQSASSPSSSTAATVSPAAAGIGSCSSTNPAAPSRGCDCAAPGAGALRTNANSSQRQERCGRVSSLRAPLHVERLPCSKNWSLRLRPLPGWPRRSLCFSPQPEHFSLVLNGCWRGCGYVQRRLRGTRCSAGVSALSVQALSAPPRSTARGQPPARSLPRPISRRL